MSQQEIDADRDRWLAARRYMVTASEIAAVVGVAPPEYGSAWKVYAAKTTGEHYDGDTDATLRGTHLEGYVADRFAADRKGDLRLAPGGLYQSVARPWQGATFDRLAYPAGDAAPWAPFPVEIKTSATTEGWGEPGTSEIPLQYRAQCLWEMDVAGAAVVLVPCLFIASWKLSVYRLDRDDDAERDIIAMRAEAQDFLRRIEDNNPPPVDWSPATTAALKARYQAEPDGEAAIPVKLARRYRAARLAKIAAEQRLGQAVNEMLALAGDAKYLTIGTNSNATGRGERVAVRHRYPRTSYDHGHLRDNYPDAAKATQRKTMVSALQPAPWAKPPRDERTLR